ncbi:Transmembrane protein [Pseudolycoriella hygida]|uniref:Transmembrane protein n=1 Tax=Pseudolycoriella hygida TaxID=35572 RepID=A0A9Q0N9E3_9DIPT|nr:Transmembrane protein [Pseudolycoriella hygida]
MCYVNSMTKKGRKSRSHSRNADVTIREFADSRTITNRSKKTSLEVIEEMFDLPDIDDLDDEGRRIAKPAKQPLDSTPEDHVYSTYPVDIWFLIAEQIRPEDVGRFSLICKTTASVVATPSFWFSMYKRHYTKTNDSLIPVRLQPDCMVRWQGLRSCVIRSLFFTYKPFVERLPALAKQDFHSLKSFWIVSSWVQPDKDDWTFCYKLRNHMPRPTECNRGFNNYRDIFFNPENGCKVLVVTTKKYCPLPDLRGSTSYVLTSINYCLTTNLRDYRLTLVFSNYQKQKVHSTVKTVVYEPVMLVQVLDWWTPAYNELK